MDRVSEGSPREVTSKLVLKGQQGGFPIREGVSEHLKLRHRAMKSLRHPWKSSEVLEHWGAWWAATGLSRRQASWGQAKTP